MKLVTVGPQRRARLLRNSRQAIAFAFLTGAMSAIASTPGGYSWFPAAYPISTIEAIGGSGGFVVYPTGFSDTNCAPSNAIYIYPGVSPPGVTQAGANQMLAAALTARTTGATINIYYYVPTSGGPCWGSYFQY